MKKRPFAIGIFVLLVVSCVTDTRDLPVGYQLFNNEQYHFSFVYPENSEVTSSNGSFSQYLRIQNHTVVDDGKYLLNPGEYILEMFLYDHSHGQKYGFGEDGKVFTDCRLKFVSYEAIKIGDQVGYRGKAKAEGDVAGELFRLCIQKSDLDLIITVAENDKNGPIANKILDSFTIK